MQHFEAYTPFWRVVNRALTFILAAVILVSGLAFMTQSFTSDGLISDSVDLPTATDYDEPNIRLGIVYGSSVKASYSFTAQGDLTYGYNKRSNGEFVSLGTLGSGAYKVKNGGGYTVVLSHFEDGEIDASDFSAVYQKAKELLSVYNLPLFTMLTENGMLVCIGVYDTEEAANSQAGYMYTDLGMDNVFGGDGDITEGDLTDGSEVPVEEDTDVPAEGPVVAPLYMEFASHAFSSNSSLVLYNASSVPVYACETGYWHENKMAVKCNFDNGEYLAVGTSNIYESPFEFSRYKSGSSNGVSVVTIIALEKYIKGVLSEELYTSWDHEVQKTFAIMIRTYSIKNRGKHGTYGFDLCANTNCQVYNGRRKINDNVSTAVNETKGVVLTYNGNVATVYYATVAGGVTVNCEDSWSSEVSYLKAVPTPWESYKDYGNLTIGGQWHVEYTGQQLYEKLASSYTQLDSEIVDVKIDSFAKNSSYVYQITFTDANGHTATIKKADTIRNRLGLRSGNFVIGKAGQSVQRPIYELDCYPSIYNPNRTLGTYYKASNVTFASVWSGGSTLVSGLQSVAYPDGDRTHDLSNSATEIVMPSGSIQVTKDGLPDILSGTPVMYYETVKLQSTSGASNVFVIEGKGYGHGIGICQYGAWDLAQAGYDYLTILRYYFKNVTFGLAGDYV